MPGRDVEIYTTTKDSVCYKNLVHCASVWACPICQHKIKNQRADELTEVIEKATAQGYELAHLILTTRHNSPIDFKKIYQDVTGTALYNAVRKIIYQYESLIDAFRSIVNSRDFKYLKKKFDLNFCKSLEITYGFINGFHPHFHVIIFFKTSGFDIDIVKDALEKCIIDQWLNIFSTALRSNQVLKILKTDNYKDELGEYVNKPSLIYEFVNPLNTKQSRNEKGLQLMHIPFLLLTETDELKKKQLETIYYLYAKAIKGKAFQTWSFVGRKTFKSLYVTEKTENEIVSDTSELKELVQIFSKPLWSLIVRRNARLAVINTVHRCVYDTSLFIGVELQKTLAEFGINAKTDSDKYLYIN